MPCDQSAVRQYLTANKRLTLLNGKRPLITKWPTTTVADTVLLSHNGNLGWVIGDQDLVVDVDPRNGGDKSLRKLLNALRVDDPFVTLPRHVTTPSGGFHSYLSLPDDMVDMTFRKTLKRFPGIDFLAKGSQCVIATGKTSQGKYKWHDDVFGGFEQHEAPTGLLTLLARRPIRERTTTVNQIVNANELGDFEGLLGGTSPVWAEKAVVELLDKLDPSIPNDEWVKVGMALHDWDPQQGLKLWEEWSKAGETYIEGETDRRWRSFTADMGVTLGTVVFMGKQTDYDADVTIVNDIIDAIAIADEKRLHLDIIPKCRRLNLSEVNNEKIIAAVRQRVKMLTGLSLSMIGVRKMIVGQASRGELVNPADRPEWCHLWAYVNSHASFANLTTLELHKTEAFNLENGKFVPALNASAKQSASKFVADRGFVDKVDGLVYHPQSRSTICDVGGSSMLNTFKHSSVPLASQSFTPEGLRSISFIKDHIKFICSTRENADIFTQWLAHQIQFPGRHILWAPVIQSIQGAGKSFFGELLRTTLGDRNVGTVSSGQVVSNFNGWATGVVVNILEELRIRGHNRHEAVNALKPLITDRMIQINDKGVRQYTTYNTANYLCFTNYRDALPLEIDDRRWWVLFVRLQRLSDLPKYVGKPTNVYFSQLFNALKNHSDEVRKWLLEYPITPAFLATKHAPMTLDKEAMIATEDAGVEGLVELRDLIRQGNKYFNTEVLCSTELFQTLAFDYPNITLNMATRNALLKRLGYMASAKPIKIAGKTRRVWSKRHWTNEETRLLLEHYPDDNIDEL